MVDILLASFSSCVVTRRTHARQPTLVSTIACHKNQQESPTSIPIISTALRSSHKQAAAHSTRITLRQSRSFARRRGRGLIPQPHRSPSRQTRDSAGARCLKIAATLASTRYPYRPDIHLHDHVAISLASASQIHTVTCSLASESMLVSMIISFFYSTVSLICEVRKQSIPHLD